MLQRFRSAIAALSLIVLLPSVQAAAEPTPTDEIQKYYDVLYDTWQRAEELGYDGRFKLLEPAVRQTFNMGYIAQFTVGRYWKQLNDEQQAALVEAVTRLSAATYASRFDKYSGEQFVVLDQKETSRGDLLVLTNIIDSKGKPVDINYLMRKNDEAWRIVDIHLKGTISELATRRSEYMSVMKRQGYDGLMSAIDKRIAALAE